ncbi:MAG TPA: S41 family peptidase [Chitinophagaceae bacterium]|nr:S41 family peptidase [Chitinophagaceae bacterium]
MRRLFSLSVWMLFPMFMMAQPDPTWLRYPAISPDGSAIVFTYRGDLYKVPATGGTATILTLHEGHDFMPVWSNDGNSIAFASDRYGNFDVYTIPASGGPATRLTYHSSQEFPYSFTNDGKNVVFSSARADAAANRQFPTGYMTELYQVSIAGGRPIQILTTPAENTSFSSKGNLMIYNDRKGGENIWRKHHTSSVARDIWSYDMKSGVHAKLTSFNGEDRDPVLSSDEKSVYFLSEESGSFNVHKMGLSGGKTQQLTRFKKHPVRFLSSSNSGVLCFSYAGQLYTMKEGAEPKKVSVKILADARTNSEQVLKVSSGSGISVSPNGKEVAFVYRGEVFVTSVEGGVTKRITQTPEQETEVSFSPDGKAIIYGSERNGRWRIYESRVQRKEEPYFYASTLISEKALIDNDNENTQPKYSPDGKEIAFIENRNFLKVLNLATKQTRTLLNGDQLYASGENDQYFEWSPDSKWLLFNYDVPGSAAGEVGIVSADGKTIRNITENGFNDSRAKWIMGGKAMMWFSNRDGLRAAAMSGGATVDAYAIFFTQEAFDRFRLSKEEFALVKESEEAAAKADTSKKKTPRDSSVVIDWDGLNLRKAKLTIHSSSMGDALVSKDGENLYYLARFERGMNLWTTNLRTRETKMLVPLNANFASMKWDKDQKNIFVNSEGGISKIDAASGKQDRVAINGEMTIDMDKERAYMFSHVWRKTKKTFYTESFHGINWDSYKADYEAYLTGIGNNHEFAEMLSEMLGELNVSHCGASFNTSNPNGDATASLGAFYDPEFKGPGVKILEIIKDGPLDKAGLNVKAGMVIEAIDGEVITADKDLAQYLNRKAGKNILLSVFDGTIKREIAIKPVSIGEENGLLYKRWVKRNADEVEKLSGGALGYVHIPGMSDGSFRTTYEDVMGKYFGKKGIVVDTRNNGGGDLVADLAMFLSGRKFMDYGTDKRSFGYEPNFRWTKPSISLVNEANYSDGHCYAYMVQVEKIGKLVGTSVPGTCTFAGWEALMDTGIRWGVPPSGCKDINGRYLENSPTAPDLEVFNEYDKVGKGMDQQLAAAVSELMKEVKK